jgi:hypothetical protein
MDAETELSPVTVETRLAALEATVVRLRSIVEPSFTVSNMAAPVAAASLKEASQHEFSGKFFALLDLGETLLKYSAAIAFAAVAGGSDAGAVDEVMKLFKQPPTLGKIAGGLRDILNKTPQIDWPLDVVSATFRRPNKKPTSKARYLLDEFISIRNDERGHGAHQPEGYYESLYLKNSLIIQDCVTASTYIQLPLVHVHAVDHHNGQYSYKVTLLMGGAASRMAEPILTMEKVRAGSTCLWDRGLRLFPLREFLMYRYCNICTTEHIFFAEQITDDSIFLHSYIGNHRIVISRTEQ